MHSPAIIIHLSAVMIIFVIIDCATLPKDFDRPESYALTDTEDPWTWINPRVLSIFSTRNCMPSDTSNPQQ